MKKILFFILLNGLITGFLFSDNINKYDINLIKTIPIGSEEGKIGWSAGAISGGGVPGPSTFAISEENKIYVPDRRNYRINVYDLNFNYLRSFIDDEKMCAYSDEIKFDELGNIIFHLNYKGLKKVNEHGNMIFKVDGNDLPDKVKYQNNYFPLNDQIFYYNDNDEIEKLSGNGKKESRAIILKELDNLSVKYEKSKNTRSNNIEDLPDDKKEMVKNLRKDLKHIIIGDQFFSSDFSKTKEYFEKLINDKLKVIKAKKMDKAQTSGAGSSKEVEIDLDKYSLGLIGYDNEHNSYWGAIEKQEIKGAKNQLIIIFSKHGELLDAFYRGQIFRNESNTELYATSGAKVAVSTSGDIYFMVEPSAYFVPPTKESEAKGGEGHWVTPTDAVYKFYKIQRQW